MKIGYTQDGDYYHVIITDQQNVKNANGLGFYQEVITDADSCVLITHEKIKPTEKISEEFALYLIKNYCYRNAT
jgi:hypothetical protein